MEEIQRKPPFPDFQAIFTDMRADPASWMSRLPYWAGGEPQTRAPAVVSVIFNPSPTLVLDTWSLPRAGSDRPGSEKLTGASEDPIYFLDSNPIELRDLGLRHPVLRQSADATKLGGRDLPLGGRLSPYLFRLRSRFDLRCIHRHHRRDREDTWLPSRLMLG